MVVYFYLLNYKHAEVPYAIPILDNARRHNERLSSVSGFVTKPLFGEEMAKMSEYIFESTASPYVRVQRDTWSEAARPVRSARHFPAPRQYLVNYAFIRCNNVSARR